jgi:hypothetical protein
VAKIRIEIKGIAVNFQRQFHPFLPVELRTVLINGHDINAAIRGATIPPHFAMLSGPGLSAPLPLNGVTLSVRDAVGDFHVDSSIATLPNLTELTASVGETLGPPSLAVLLGANPDLVACYLDFNHGRFSACSDQQAASTHVEVENGLVGPDAPVILDLTPFPTAPFPRPSTTSIAFPDGSTVIVQNVSVEEMAGSDTMVHFYLSYLTAATLPNILQLPIDGLGSCPIRRGIAGPGCSDSNYP